MPKNIVESDSAFISYNLPGISGYSQRGSKGNTGERGSCIYYTPYAGNAAECISLIERGKELSNNVGYSPKDVEYKTGDMILDINGDMWIITLYYDRDDPTIVIAKVNKINNIISYFSNTANNASHGLIEEFTVSRDTDAEYGTVHSYARYKGSISENIDIPHQYYRDRYRNHCYGNWYKMNVTFVDTTILPENYLYKYVIVLPNGIPVEQISPNASDWIFIDNRLLYGIRSINIKDASFGELKSTIDYRNFNTNNENTYALCEKYDRIIQQSCIAYVEIMDKQCGKIYRIYSKITDPINE